MTKDKTYPLRSLTAFALAATALCAAQPAEANGYHHHRSRHYEFIDETGGELSPTYDATTQMKFLIANLEGSGYVANDNGHGPSKYGIVGVFNGLSPDQVRHLSYGQAADIYARKYAKGIGDLPRREQPYALNAAVQFSPEKAWPIINAANGDPDTLMRMSYDRYNALCVANIRNCRYVNAWHERLKKVERYIELADNSVKQDTAIAAKDVVIGTQSQIAQAGKGTSDRQFDNQPRQSRNSGLPLSLFFAAGIGLAGLKRRKPPVLPSDELSDDEPMFNLQPIKKLIATVTGDDSWLDQRDRQQAYSTRASYGLSATQQTPLVWPEFYELERHAFDSVFARHAHEADALSRGWHVHYPDNSHVTVAHGRIHLRGDGGIEDSLRFAALAWNGDCKLTGGSPEERARIMEAAQRLVDSGEIQTGFRINGVALKRGEAPAPTASRPESVSPAANDYVLPEPMVA